MKIITIDVGTSSMKSLLYDENGKLYKYFVHEYYSDYPKPDYVEQDPLSWKEALEDVLVSMGRYCNDEGYEVEAISVTSQRSSMIPMDKDGNFLYPAIMWQDKRTIDICDSLIEEYTLEYFYNKTGLRMNPYFVLPKIMWLKENEPNIYEKTYKFIGVQDYVVYLLTNNYKTDYSQACRTMMMDIRKFKWDKDLMDFASIDENKLPELLAPGSKAGGLVDNLAKMANLRSDIPVIMAGGDQQNAAVALGVIKQGRVEANTGTGSFMIAAIDKPIFDDNCRVLCQASAIPGKYLIEAGIFNTGAVYRWFRNNFYSEYKDSTNIYQVMNEEAQKSNPGSNGIILIPHFLGSAAPYWNPYSKGLFFNISLDDTRGDFTRAILEGISTELAINLSLIKKMIDGIELVSVAGGMVQSDLFCQIQADLFKTKVIRHENNEATSLGAAMSAFVSLGKYSDIEEALKYMGTSYTQEFLPSYDGIKIYEKVYERNLVLYDTLSLGNVYKAFE